MRIFSLICSLLLFIPGLALADGTDTRCTYGDMVRRVVILSEPGVSVPCEVHYYKDTESPGEDEVLWSAAQQAGYCEEKAAGLVERLEGFGWECGSASAPEAADSPAAPEPAEAAAAPEAPETPEAPTDTTGDLAPAEPESGGN